MPPIIKETDAAAAPEPGAARDNIQARQQTVALEVPVTVNGGRAIEGSDQREQFSESTKTVLVHGNGAVIRLNSPVTPGQLLFLTNERTKKEIVCQVVKSKSHDHLSGYVELEFTEAVAGFWGMRFPGERSAAQPRAATPIPTATRSIEAELEPLSAAPSAAEMARAQYGQEGKKDASQFTGLVTGQAKHVPFTAELKSDERGTTQAGFLESAPSANATPLDRESLAAQEEVSSPDPVVDVVPQSFKEASSGTVAAPPSALKDQEFASAATKLFEMAQPDSSPNKLEPSSNLFDLPAKQENVQIEPSLKVEEVKVPAWLEPVARSAAPAAPKKDEATDLAPLSEKPDESEDAKPKKSAATSVVRQPRRAEPQIPVFRTTVLDHHTPSAPEPVASGGMNKGAWILGAAAIVVFAAAGVTWYLRQPMEPQAPPNPLSAATLPITSASTVASSPMPTNVPDVQAAQSAAPVEIR
jgi:hypothetical protein